MADEREEISRRAEEIKAEVAALNTLLGGYASKYDLQKALDEERVNAKAAAQGKNLWRNVAVAAAIIIGLLAGAGVLITRRQTDQRYEDRVRATIEECNRNNETAREIDAGNEAKAAIVASARGLQAELDGIITPVLDDGATRTPEEQARYELFKNNYQDGAANVNRELAEADAKITAAHVEQRSCTRDDVLHPSGG